MMWLEMSRDAAHGGGEWEFTKCLWAPVHKKGVSDSSWPYWESLLRVRVGDSVLHLRGRGKTAAFTGYSVAATDGFITAERPSIPGTWGYDSQFYKVPLCGFQPFDKGIPLNEVFLNKDAQLREYFIRNKSKSLDQKKRLFYVIQAERLQCQNGAYLSEVDAELAGIILGSEYSGRVDNGIQIQLSTKTGEQIRSLEVREGHQQFSGNVKGNYGYRCCFPGCSINDHHFLIGSHITRWADETELRGDTNNGLCLCVLHDKAFELGYFTLDANFCVVLNEHNVSFADSIIFKSYIEPYKGHSIKIGLVKPSIHALRNHWDRLSFPLRESY